MITETLYFDTWPKSSVLQPQGKGPVKLIYQMKIAYPFSYVQSNCFILGTGHY